MSAGEGTRGWMRGGMLEWCLGGGGWGTAPANALAAGD